MSILTGTLAMGRVHANARMTETVVAESVTITSDNDGNPVRTVTATHYTGSAQVKYPSLVVSEPNAGSAQFAAADVTVKIPSGSPRIPVGAEFRVTASTADALLVARTFRVKGSPQSGQTTAHRYPVEEQQ